MGVLNSKNNNQSKVVASSLVKIVAIAALVFSILVIATATQLANSNGIMDGKIGPLSLFTMSRLQSADSAISGGLSLNSKGLIIYATSTIVLGLGYGFFHTSIRNKK